MTIREIETELEREPFVPLRLHLSEGQAIDVPRAGVVWTMRNALLVFHPGEGSRYRVSSYDIVSLRHIARIEQVNGVN
jgi:hypothetical protein